MSGAHVYALNIHAGYACRHSNACCTAGWSIPVEPARQALLGVEWLTPSSDGTCPQLDRSAHRCRVHRDHGEAALPESCRHFPRRSLVDARGTFVSLSHFCPTAASLLVESDGPLSIVEGPAAFPQDRAYDGLDARREWPPLLRPDALFDYESFSMWERFLVAALGSPVGDVSSTLTRIAGVAERLRAWSAAYGPLRAWTAATLASQGDGMPGRMQSALTGNLGDSLAQRYRAFLRTEAFESVCATVPAALAPPTVPDDLDAADAAWVAPHWQDHAGLVLRFLASKSFASWTPYQARGIRTHVAELFAAAGVLRVECARICANQGVSLSQDTLLGAIRMTDWLLVHLADREQLMAWLGRIETCEEAFAGA
ncbi:MAG: hypothetical protein ABMA15_09810 [Vicinamibacterales bacterium]